MRTDISIKTGLGFVDTIVSQGEGKRKLVAGFRESFFEAGKEVLGEIKRVSLKLFAHT